MATHHQIRGCFTSIFLLLLCFSTFPGAMADVNPSTDLKSYQQGKMGKRPRQGFFSAPSIKAPIYQINTLNLDKADDSPFIFLTGQYSDLGSGPSIISSKDLSLVWADERHGNSQALRPYTFHGEPVLAAYAGGRVRIYNQRYQEIYHIRPQGDPKKILPDHHECHLTKDGTVIQVAGQFEPLDLSEIGGPKRGEGVRDNRIQEVDPVTNELKLDFSMLNHFSLDDSYWPYNASGIFNITMDCKSCHDFVHVNSVEKTPNGDYLVSSRHLSSIFLISGKTRQVKWIMGGKRNQFRDISETGNASFAYQHNVQLTAPNRIILFDNAALNNGFCHNGRRCSRGLEIEFDVAERTAKFVNAWYHPQSIVSASRGGVQRLPNGGTFVAWGQNGMYTEYSADGEVVMDFQRSMVTRKKQRYPGVMAYRAWKGDWEGKPVWGPNISANGEQGRKKIHVSWNGATNVEKWVLLLSDSLDSLDGPGQFHSQLPRMGFETSFKLAPNNNRTFARVAAIDEENNIIGSTPAVNISSGRLHRLNYEISQVGLRVVPPVTAQISMEGSASPALLYFTISLNIVLCLLLFHLVQLRGKKSQYQFL